jgi:hypothetical protein
MTVCWHMQVSTVGASISAAIDLHLQPCQGVERDQAVLPRQGAGPSQPHLQPEWPGLTARGTVQVWDCFGAIESARSVLNVVTAAEFVGVVNRSLELIQRS